jgi:hypothetical protein
MIASEYESMLQQAKAEAVTERNIFTVHYSAVDKKLTIEENGNITKSYKIPNSYQMQPDGDFSKIFNVLGELDSGEDSSGYYILGDRSTYIWRVKVSGSGSITKIKEKRE